MQSKRINRELSFGSACRIFKTLGMILFKPSIKIYVVALLFLGMMANNAQAQAQASQFYRDTTISLSYKSFEIELRTFLYDHDLAEKWTYYNQDVPYGFLRPYVIKQVLIFYQKGNIVSQKEIKISTSLHKTCDGKAIVLQNLPVFDIGIVENKQSFFFMVYGANYCAGVNCPEFIGIYAPTGEVVSESLSYPEKVLTGESLSEVLKEERLDINRTVRKASILDVFNVMDE